jgi:hypothetical protein
MNKNFSDKIGHSIFSLGAVLFPLLILIGGMLFVSHTYFYSILPETMEEWQRTTAAWFIATAWELTVLVTTANHAHVPRWITRVMAIAVGVIMLFYLNAFAVDIRIQKFLFGTLVAFTSWVFVELFAKKWRERTAGFTLPELLASANKTIDGLQSRFDETTKSLIEVERNEKQIRSTLNENNLELIELRAFRANIREQLTCEHCSSSFESYDAVRSHKGGCVNNPNRRNSGKNVKMNGHDVV